jgi:hypothetical protein
MPTGWEDFLLAENPQWSYFSSAPFTTSQQQGYSPAQQNYWRGQFGNVWNRYMGELGSATRSGQQFGTFDDYLENMPFTQMYYQNVSPQERGRVGRYNPATRFVF